MCCVDHAYGHTQHVCFALMIIPIVCKTAYSLLRLNQPLCLSCVADTHTHTHASEPLRLVSRVSNKARHGVFLCGFGRPYI